MVAVNERGRKVTGEMHLAGERNGAREQRAEGERKRTGWLAPTLLLAGLALVGGGLAWWKISSLKHAAAAAQNQPEPVEMVTLAVANERQHRRISTAIGTVVALRSITLRNEIAGTVREVNLAPGQIVEAGTVLVALDVSVEEAELKAQEAQSALARTQSERMTLAARNRATSQMEADRARAELDVAEAQIERIKAVIARKTIRAPFRARLGISNVHPGQYLIEGTLITTLQGVDDSTHVDFEVAQQIARGLREGDTVEVVSGPEQPPVPATIVALDALIDPVTRNTTVRARVADAKSVPAPGASVRVRVPAGEAIAGVSIPVSALRKGPAGDHVFVVVPDQEGKPRAQTRRVQAGASLGDEVLIVAGLTAGETVAASGSFKLREGVLVAAAGQPGETAKQN
jgi:membrane fusion protein (multidrug efflux system)